MNYRLALAASLLAIGSTSLQARVFMVDDAEQLGAAIAASNESREADLIDMAPGLYVLDERSALGDQSGLPEITGDLHIRGNGAEIRRYDRRDFELMRIGESGRLHLDRVTLAEGSAGALTNRGTLVLRRVRIVDHSTADRGVAVISNFGDMTLSNVELGYNLVDALDGEASVLVNYGNLNVTDSQFVDNRLSTRHPEAHIACALLNHGRAELHRVNVSGCLAEQLDLSSAPRAIINAEGGALLVEQIREESVQLQLYGSPMTAAVD